MPRPGLPDLAILNGQLLTMDDDADLVPVRGSVLIRDGRIVAITQDKRPQARESISAEGKLVLPGFVDAHCHSIHLLLRGMSDGLSYHEWLENLMYRALPAYRAEDARVASQLFCAEAIKSGITTVADSTDFGNRADLVQSTLAGFQRAGIRHVYFRNFSDAPPPALAANRESARQALAHTEELIVKYNGRSALTIIGPGINEPHLVTARAFRAAVSLAERRKVPIMVHIAEVPADVMIDGMNVIDWMIRHRSLSGRLALAHCVWLSPADFAKIAAAGAAVTWQPSTNAFLADGIMPLRSALDAGVAVGLGTDDTNANDQVNMFTELRTAALMTKIARADSAAVAAWELLRIATQGGARVLGMGNQIGSIKVGKAADLILIDLDAMRPITNLASALVYQACGTEVETVVINGRVVMRERELVTLDERSLRRKAQRCAEGVLRRSGLSAPPSRLAPATGGCDCAAWRADGGRVRSDRESANCRARSPR
jgi:cytosine/adenosine deaminase-related metal-dependent hydrolase